MALREQTWTVEQYLEFERTSEEKHEYLDGQIYLMGGASHNHSIITATIIGILYTPMRSRPCSVFDSDMRVKAGRLYTYPDITVVCGTPQYTDDNPDTLLNPTLIIEVLSPSTERYDRGKKFEHYRALESLQEYVLVSQDRPLIEHYIRQPDGQWLFSDASGLDSTLTLPSIGCTLALADVYEKVTFEGEDE